MLKKRIKKYICVLSAVIIAFSSFSVSALSDDINISDMGFALYYEIFDENGNYIESVDVFPNSYDVFYEDNLLYFDVFYSDKIQPGYSLDFYLTYDWVSAYPNSYVIFYLADGLDYKSSVYGYFDLNGYVSSELIKIDNSYSALNNLNGSSSSIILRTSVSRYFDSFSCVIEVANCVDDLESYVSRTNAAPRKYKFFSDIGSFFRTAVEWMSDIFDKFVENPAILVLVIGFVIVGFCFGLLRKIIFES